MPDPGINEATPPQPTPTNPTAAVSAPAETIPHIADISTPTTTPAPTDTSNELKKCWICFADESEDTDTTSAWRNPCPCALVAHEACLLDWVADMEQSARRRRSNHDSASGSGPLCPQCKTRIELRRPRDPIVALTTALDRVVANLVFPAAGTLTASLIYSAFTAHGVHSVAMIFGAEDARRILAPMIDGSRMLRSWSVGEMIEDFKQHMGLYLGIPFITPALLMCRTELSDSVLPLLPLAFLSVHGVEGKWGSGLGGARRRLLDVPSWPPSAAFVVALLPYVRMAYNGYYKRVWSKRVQAWDKALEPRAGRSDAEMDEMHGGGDAGQRDGEVDNDDDLNEMDDMHDHEAVFELRLDGNLFQNWAGGVGAGVPPEEPLAAMEQPAAVAGQNEDAPPVGQGRDQDLQPQMPRPAQADDAAANGVHIQRDQRIAFSTIGLVEKLLGSLLFPTASALAGQALLALLPLSWTTPSAAGPARGFGSVLFRKIGIRPSGLLQERWGRSIVGGCLLVVFKDALMLYVKWRMVQQHRLRRVLDYKGPPRIKT